MKTFLPPATLARDPNSCRDAIVEALNQGCLSLFIGAGVSLSAGGFPSWPDLVQGCCQEVGVIFDPSKAGDNNYLLMAGERFRKECGPKGKDLRDVMEAQLYARVPRYDKSLMKTDLLIALGAMVMNSIRGRASCVINYNYDDLLEWYLMHHGFNVKIVADFPELLGKHDLAIYHPHGFLPLSLKFKQWRSSHGQVVISKDDYQEAIAEHSPWNEFQKSQFGTSVALFIGMSGDDEHVQSLFRHAYKKLIKQRRVVGFMLLEDTPKNRDKEEEHRDRGIIHVYLASHDHLPDYLLEVCRMAVEL